MHGKYRFLNKYIHLAKIKLDFLIFCIFQTEEAAGEGDLMQYGNTRGDPKYRIELEKFLTKMYGVSVNR